MTYRNYLIKNNPTSSYLLRIKIPKDLRCYFEGRIGFTMSLKNGIHSQSIGFAKILRLEVQSICVSQSICLRCESGFDMSYKIKIVWSKGMDETDYRYDWGKYER